MGHHKPLSDQILVGTHLVTLVGLRDALREASSRRLPGREAVVDFLVEVLSAENYIPDTRLELYRTALWREVLRLRGEDFSDFLSEIPVTVLGDPGEGRDRFVERVESVLEELELRPVITFAPPASRNPEPQLVIDDQVVVAGLLGRAEIKAAVDRSISGW